MYTDLNTSHNIKRNLDTQQSYYQFFIRGSMHRSYLKYNFKVLLQRFGLQFFFLFISRSAAMSP